MNGATFAACAVHRLFLHREWRAIESSKVIADIAENDENVFFVFHEY